MNNPVDIQSVTPQLVVSSPAESPKNRRWPLWSVIGLSLLLLGAIIGLFSAKFLNQSPFLSQISSYTECLAAKGSIVQESYPATCVTAFGRRFTQSVSSTTPESVVPTFDSTTECQLCSGAWDPSCPGNQSCFVPDGQVQGVCLPIPKMGQVFDVAQVNQQCGTNFPITASPPVTSSDRKTSCKQYGGNWLEQYQECEKISKQQCNLLDGSFAECESACRHDSTADKCITLCVGVCSFP